MPSVEVLRRRQRKLLLLPLLVCCRCGRVGQGVLLLVLQAFDINAIVVRRVHPAALVFINQYHHINILL